MLAMLLNVLICCSTKFVSDINCGFVIPSSDRETRPLDITNRCLQTFSVRPKLWCGSNYYRKYPRYWIPTSHARHKLLNPHMLRVCPIISNILNDLVRERN